MRSISLNRLIAMDTMESMVEDLDSWIPGHVGIPNTLGSPHTWWGADINGGLASCGGAPGGQGGLQ